MLSSAASLKYAKPKPATKPLVEFDLTLKTLSSFVDISLLIKEMDKGRQDTVFSIQAKISLSV